MFNTTILDVAIGMIFIYLLLSLMCTAANEIIELMLKKRAVDLERGIRELLVPGSASGTNDIVQRFYNHSLVNGLFGGRYENSKIASVIRYVWRTQLPSYIPARTFALALMDLVLPGTAGLSGAAGATPPPASFDVTLATPPPPPPPPTNPANPLEPLRTAIGANPIFAASPQAREALTTLIDAAGSDVAKARENIENWYDTSMDRVSSWYKRRSQVVILIIGLFVAIAVNADSITIAKRLSTDRALRESLVAAAQEYAKAHASPSATPPSSRSESTKSSQSAASPSTAAAEAAKPSPLPASTSTPVADASPTETAKPSPLPTLSSIPVADVSPTVTVKSSPSPASPSAAAETSPSPPPPPPACRADENSDQCKHDKDLQKKIPACAKDLSSAECALEEKLLKIQVCVDDRNSPECKYEENLMRIQDLGLPIGWDAPGDKWPGLHFWEGKFWPDWYARFRFHFLGWLLTALAISLGAPFWFDLLNKFIVIRSAVKPHEKSPEEGSKD